MNEAKRYRAAVLGTCCVPWREDYTLAEEVFRRSVRHLIGNGIRDLYVFGTAGEGYAVTEGQFDEIARVFLEETRGEGVQSMVGLISLSLPTVIERIERVRTMGGRRFQLTLPSWGALRDAEVATFFRETCGRFPDCEFLHYNLMRTGRILTGAEYGQLAARHPNLVATKNSTADEARLKSLLGEAPQLRHFITEAGFAKASGMGGGCGFLISLASMNLGLGQEYFRAGQAGALERLGAMSRELGELLQELLAVVGGKAHMDGAFDKIFCRMHDPEFPLRLLPPYETVDEQTYERFVGVVRERFPQWLPGGGGQAAGG